MEDTAFDDSLVTAAFELIAQSGWSRLTVAGAARAAGLPLDRARTRFSCRLAILLRFGRMADMASLTGIVEDSTVRDRLLGIVMSRIDVLQAHRRGVLALLSGLPRDPLTGVTLMQASLTGMRWMLDGAGIDTTGARGMMRVKGMLGVWLYTVRAWREDETEDLSPTMAALDRALQRAEQLENSFSHD
jgi:hypothetical protein